MPKQREKNKNSVKLMFFPCRTRFFVTRGVKKWIFLPASHKVDFIAPCWQKSPFSDLQV